MSRHIKRLHWALRPMLRPIQPNEALCGTMRHRPLTRQRDKVTCQRCLKQLGVIDAPEY